MAVKLVVNTDSGNCNKLDIDKLVCKLGLQCFDLQQVDSLSTWNADGYDTVIVCGGDGTLCNALNICQNKRLVYVPCGTLNEAQKISRNITTVGSVNGSLFGYVCATGSCCSIGYTAKVCNKQRFKSLAYISQISDSYASHQIDATIDIDGKTFCGKYTLIMVIRGKRCFGFDFNRNYVNDNRLHLLAVTSFGTNCLRTKLAMFPTFARIFWLGVNKPTTNKNFVLLPFDNAMVTLSKPQDFCIDGEKRTLAGTLHFVGHTLDNPVTVMDLP